jgi:uncharacterized protein YegP (UPF0339 family)
MNKKTTKLIPRIKIKAAKTDKIGECLVVCRGRNGKVIQTSEILSSLHAAIGNIKALREVFTANPLVIEFNGKTITL